MHDQKHSRLTVSVVIPTYNRAAYLRSAIDSALKQTRVPDEIIVVDDGSTDETPDMLAQYGPPVRVIRQPNRGRSAARNHGLRCATGDAVIFLDSDDLLMPRSIERCAESLEDHPEVGVVYTDAHVIDSEGRIVARYSDALRGDRPSGMIFGELARRCFLTVTSMVRRSCLAGVRFEEGMEHCEDYDVWRKLAARYQFLFVNEPLMCYRFHEGMTVASEYSEVLDSEVEVQRRFMAMPEFLRLSRRERARVYCTHGIKNAMLDRVATSRRYFWKAMWTAPWYPGGLSLTLVSLFGGRLLRYAIIKRRRVAGNQLGTQAGPMAVVNQHVAPALEAEVQGRIFSMPEYQHLTRRERARAYCSHGSKQAMLGSTGTARRFFVRSIRTSPTYAGGYPLLLISLFGKRALQFAILKRRKMAGNTLGTKAGPIALVNGQPPTNPTTPLPAATSSAELVAAAGGNHG